MWPITAPATGCAAPIWPLPCCASTCMHRASSGPALARPCSMKDWRARRVCCASATARSRPPPRAPHCNIAPTSAIQALAASPIALGPAREVPGNAWYAAWGPLALRAWAPLRSMPQTTAPCLPRCNNTGAMHWPPLTALCRNTARGCWIRCPRQIGTGISGFPKPARGFRAALCAGSRPWTRR